MRLRAVIITVSFLVALSSAAAQYAGKPLAEALRDLEARGLKLIYSSDIVTPAMIVRREPTATEPRRILDELLREHHLRVQTGPRDSLVIVRDEAENDTAPPAEMPVAIEEIVVMPSRFKILSDEPESRHFLDREEVKRVPHLSDDLYRAIGRLPGTAGSEVSARFNLRGGAEDEVLVLVDGAEIHDPFHVRDLLRAFSTIDAEAIGAVDVLGGGFPAEYGGRISGVVNISTLSPQRIAHEAGISLLNTRLLSQGTFSDSRGSWVLSLRRGYLREVLKVIDDSNDLDPQYYDLLGKLQWTAGDNAVVSLHALAAHDRLSWHEAPGSRAKATYRDAYAWINVRGTPSARTFAQAVLSYGQLSRDRSGTFDDDIGSQFGAIDDRRRSRVAALKTDGSWRFSDRQLIKGGFTARGVSAAYDVEGWANHPFSSFSVGAPPREIRNSVHITPSGNELAAYLSDRVRLGKHVVMEIGARAASESYTPDGVNVDPRVNVLWTAGAGTSLRAAWGYFHQPHSIHELEVEDGVTSFHRSQRSEHRVFGIEHDFGAAQARIELYDKQLTHLRPRYENLYDRLVFFPELRADRIRIVPERGRARGMEILLRHEGTGPLSGWISYTRASVTDRIDGRNVPRAWDQRDAVGFSVNYRLGARWNFNVAGNYHSGTPTTPVIAQLENGVLTSAPALFHSDLLSPYHRVDSRVSHTRGRFTVFVEIFNVLNHSNVTRVDRFDYLVTADGVETLARTESVLGVVPSFGATWRF